MSVPTPNTSAPTATAPHAALALEAPQAMAPSAAPIFVPLAAAPVTSTRGSWWSEMSPLGRWGVGSAMALTGLAVIAGGVAMGLYVSWRNAGKIAPNVSIQGVAVGDMTPLQAKAALRQKFGALKVRFETPEKVYTQSLNQIGGRVVIDKAVRDAFWLGRSKSLPANALAVWNARSEPTRLGLGLKWDKKALRRQMSLVSRQYYKKPIDARLQFANGELVVIPDAPGRAINAGATLASLQKNYRIGQDRIEATVKPVFAKVSAQDLEGRDVKLGSYSTGFNSGVWGRTRNIRVAASTIDGMVMMPGEKFSFNQRTGERTWDKGYRMGHIFEDRGNGSEVVDGLAGGVCQVSTTIYNAVRKANQKLPSKVFMRINERNYHSLPVPYVPRGFDATVAWPSKDFRFSNTLTHPVFLRAVVSGNDLTVSVWGRVPHEGAASKVQLAQAPRTTS